MPMRGVCMAMPAGEGSFIMNNQERKRAERCELQILGSVSLDVHGSSHSGKDEHESYLCNIINMSLTGALVETGHSMHKGALLNYSFRMPGVAGPVKILSEIVRREGLEERQAEGSDANSARSLNTYGIRFLDLKDEDREAIKKYLAGNG